MAAEVFVALVMWCEWEWELCSRTEAVGTSCLVVERRVRGRVERLVQQRLVTGRLVGVEAEVDHAVLAVAWDVVVEDLPNFGVVWEAEVEGEEGEEGEEEEGEVEDFEVAQVVEAVEGEGEEEVGSAGAVPGFALDEQHVMGLVEPRVGDPCDRGESPG